MASRDKEEMERPVLLPYQQRWMNDKSPLKIWLASRQVGKSFSIAMEAVAEALESKCNNLVLSSSERQSKEVMRKIFSHLRCFRAMSAIEAASETKEEVTLPNGSRIISLPANPDTVRGFSGNVFLDEFAFHHDAREIWRAMYPAVARGYKVRVTSTPNGKSNMFYDLWAHTPTGGKGGWSKHKTDIHDAVREGLTVDIEGMRVGVGDPDSWAQEFECRFMDEAAAFITYEMIAACEDEGAGKEYWLQGDTEGGRSPSSEMYLGLDIGRKRDLTVFWLWEKVGDVLWTRMVHEMRNEPFSRQREFLYGLMEGTYFKNLPSPLFSKEGNTDPPLAKGGVGGFVRRCSIDATGIGHQMAEEAVARFGPRAEAVTLTQQVKEDLAVTLRRKFEDRLLRVPPDREIREDIHSVKRSATSAGNWRFDAERTEQGHADRFWAAALGAHAAGSAWAPVVYEAIERRRSASLNARWGGQTAIPIGG